MIVLGLGAAEESLLCPRNRLCSPIDTSRSPVLLAACTVRDRKELG